MQFFTKQGGVVTNTKYLLTAMNPGKKTYMASRKPIDSPAVFTKTARLPACIIAITIFVV